MKKRLVVVSLFTFALLSLLIAQYFKIQVVDGKRWTKLALSQHECVVKEPFRRGTFFSNRADDQETVAPTKLVYDVTKYHLFIDPMALPLLQKEVICDKLATFVDVDDREKFSQAFYKHSRSRKIATWLDRNQKEAILSWWRPFARSEKIVKNALFFVADYKRSYPYGKLLGQVLHTIREMKNETTGQAIPTGGLEAKFHTLLTGKEGRRLLVRSPLNRLETNQVIEKAENGADIILTIDHTIQAICEDELEKGVAAAQAKGGWAIVLEPHTGEVLALAHTPFFHPENYKQFYNDPNNLDVVKAKGVTDAYEVGSIMKPISIATYLKANEILKEEGKRPLFTPEEKIETTRTLFPGRGRKPLKDGTSHRYLNMYMALQRSSNIYPALLMERLLNQLGPQWYRSTLQETFGFGTITKIELPAEASGFLPTPNHHYTSGAPEWSLSTPYSLCRGYNLMATGIQMVRAYAVFANGGVLIEPTLVRQVVKNGQVILDNHLKKRAHRFRPVLSQEIVTEITRGLKYVTRSGGTGYRARIYGYTVAGKSGTAEQVENGAYNTNKHLASFIGFTPANLDPATPPRFVLLVSLDEPKAMRLPDGSKNHMGGRCAAPIFAAIAERTLSYLGVAPDDPFGYPYKDPRFDAHRADWLKQTNALKQLYDNWNG